ncbi:MAG: D-aminoacyl-tRNA deacylase [Vicinamibacterales bacterium]|nr:D-aminoacyl-tRNA deacylase [Vicinamibacterales bacterium]
MRAVVQRVRTAQVAVDGVVVGAIRAGLIAYIGVTRDDGPDDAQYIAAKIVEMRIFEDDAGKLNQALSRVGGAILAVSQFTLYGDCRRGRRPSFDQAAPADAGRLLFDDVVRRMRALGAPVETGQFQAHMIVTSENDGPVTMLLDSRRHF